jgi:hypothetical protein
MAYYVILIFSLALAGFGAAWRSRSLAAGNAMAVAGLLGCVACITWQVRQVMFTPEPAGPDRAQAVVAYYLANRFMAETGGEVKKVVLILPPETVLDEESAAAFTGTFVRVLRGATGLRLETARLSIDSKTARSGKIPVGAFRAITDNASGAAIVSFAGVAPGLTEANLEKVTGMSYPTWFVYDPWGTTNWVGGLRNGRIRAVVVPRPDVSRTKSQVAGEPNEILQRFYLTATRETAQQVAAQMVRSW